ncbi:unnamed protein product, partial [Iphiclides podalirius]
MTVFKRRTDAIGSEPRNTALCKPRAVGGLPIARSPAVLCGRYAVFDPLIKIQASDARENRLSRYAIMVTRRPLRSRTATVFSKGPIIRERVAKQMFTLSYARSDKLFFSFY